MIPFVGPSYQLNTRKADVQRTVNMFVVIRETPSGKSVLYLKSVPGLNVFSIHDDNMPLFGEQTLRIEYPDEDFGFSVSPL
jgi:hypothetical protein